MRLRSKAPLLLIAGAVLAAGCAVASPVSSASLAVRPSGPAAVSSAPPASPGQRAAAEARAMLARFVPPPGAVRLAKKPDLPSGSPTMGLNSADQADAVRYWRANGTATALLAWEKAHIWRRFARQDVLLGPPSWNTVYSLPAVPGVLPVRELNVQFYQSGGGMTVIMADAMVSWQPPRAASEAIPASVTEVSVTADGPWYGNPAPVTITSALVARRLAVLVNRLPRSTAGNNVPCPSGPAGFTLTFRGVAGGPAVAFLGPGACGSASFRLGGKDQPPLQPSTAFLAAVLKTAGLSWKPVV